MEEGAVGAGAEALRMSATPDRPSFRSAHLPSLRGATVPRLLATMLLLRLPLINRCPQRPARNARAAAPPKLLRRDLSNLFQQLVPFQWRIWSIDYLEGPLLIPLNLLLNLKLCLQHPTRNAKAAALLNLLRRALPLLFPLFALFQLRIWSTDSLDGTLLILHNLLLNLDLSP